LPGVHATCRIVAWVTCPTDIKDVFAIVAPALAEAKPAYNEWRGKDGRLYCRRTDGSTGLIIGGVGGALLGREIDHEGSKRKCVARR